MAWVSGNYTTYYGPSTSYLQAGSVANENVNILWQESSYYFIEYFVGSKKKRAYVITDAIPNPGTIPARTWTSQATRYIATYGKVHACPPTTSTPTNTNGVEVCEIARGTTVTYFVGEKPNDWAFIEFDYTNGKKVRAYYWANYMSTSTPSANTLSNFKIYTRENKIAAGLPMAGYNITQGFNDSTGGTYRGHLGYDITDPSSTTMCAKSIFPGTVVSIKTTWTTDDGIGKSVVVQHNVNNETFYSTYHHLASISVSINQTVYVDQIIGVMGNTGLEAWNLGAHLHVCLYINSSTTTPYGYCDSTKLLTFQQTSTVTNYNNGIYPQYFYGSTASDYESKYPRCGQRRFFDPYGCITSNVNDIKTYKYTLL